MDAKTGVRALNGNSRTARDQPLDLLHPLTLMASELTSLQVIEAPAYPALPPGVSFQDLDSEDSDDDLTQDEATYEEMLAAGEF